MSLTTFTYHGKSLGGTDQSLDHILFKGNPADTISGGFRIGLGDGTATPLGMDSTGVFIISSGNQITRLISMATASRDVRIADGAGYLMPAARAILGADVSSTSTSQAAVSGFTVTVAASGLYFFEMILLVTSAATTTGFRFAVTGPAEIDWVSYEIAYPVDQTLDDTPKSGQFLTAFGTAVAALAAPVATSVFPVTVRGMFKTTASTPTSPVGLTIATEVNASTVTLKAGSEILVTKRN